jgi:hypothetical protein
MTDEEKKAKMKQFEEEQALLMKEPDDKMFLVPVVANIKLNKMRYMGWRQLQHMNEMMGLEQDKREDLFSAMVGVGLDHVVKDLTKMLLAFIMKEKLDSGSGT